jgi:hypothetical protein
MMLTAERTRIKELMSRLCRITGTFSLISGVSLFSISSRESLLRLIMINWFND